MHIYSCSGTLGDTYIILCILYKIASKEPIICKHYTTLIHWRTLIRQIYSLLPNIRVEFVKQREMSYPRIHSTFTCQKQLGSLLSTSQDWYAFPKFTFPDHRFMLPNDYITLNPKSGKPKEHRCITENTIKKILATAQKPIVIIGNENPYKDMMNKNVIDLAGKTSLLEAMAIVSDANYFVGFQGLMAFVAMSHCVHSEIYVQYDSDIKAVKFRMHNQWEQYCNLRKN